MLPSPPVRHSWRSRRGLAVVPSGTWPTAPTLPRVRPRGLPLQLWMETRALAGTLALPPEGRIKDDKKLRQPDKASLTLKVTGKFFH